MYFDIATQRLKCEYCGRDMNVPDYDENNSASQDGEDMNVYLCRNCGARLYAVTPAATAFCPYCGGEQVMEGKLARYQRPRNIIPFKLTKKECKDAYKKFIVYRPFVAKELKSQEFIDKFRGIYMPYWQFDMSFDHPDQTFKGSSSQQDGNYVIEKTYDLGVQLNEAPDVPYDASSNFDDSFASQIVPFREKDICEYHPGYLAGFYADGADVDSEVYAKEAVSSITTKAAKSITDAFAKEEIRVEMPPSDKLAESFGTRIKDKRLMLFPVWFLTWRKKDRVAYITVNGDTGRIASDLPVSYGSFILCSLELAAVVFGLMTLYVSMTAPTALMFSMAMTSFALYLYRWQMVQIHDRENHVFDRGYFIEGRKSDMSLHMAEDIRKQRLHLGNEAVILMPIALIAISILITMYIMSYGMPVTKAKISSFLIVPFALYNVVPTLKLARHAREKSLIFETLVGFAGIGMGFVLLLLEAFEDWQYYLATILCLCAMAVTVIGLIRKINRLATRPMPTFFDREGGDDSEKE